MGVAEDKAHMRKEVLRRRNAMAADERLCKSREICDLVFAEVEAGFDGIAGKPAMVALFSSFGSEVELSPLTEALAGAGYRICFPAMVGDAGAEKPCMRFVAVPAEVALARDAEFLAHPSRSVSEAHLLAAGFRFVEPSEIDFAVVPLVAFDAEGGRLGYGGGNYDGFLGGMALGSKAVGVAFDEQRVERVPRESHDLPLGKVISR